MSDGSGNDAIRTPDELQAYLEERKISESAREEEGPSVDVAVVRVGAQRYAFSAQGLKQVSRVKSIARVPGCPTVIAGLVPVGGAIVGAVDAGELLGVERDSTQQMTYIMIYDIAGERIGVMVSAVDEVVRISSSAFRELECSEGGAFVSSEVQYSGQCIPYLDVNLALSDLPGEETHG